MEPDASSTRERWQTSLLVVVLVAVGGVAWFFQLRPPLEVVDAGSLDALPRRIEAWVASDVPLRSTVEAILRADHNVQRVYEHPDAPSIALYVGYYGTRRGGRPEHTPQVCYPMAGWAVIEQGDRVVDGDRGLRVNEMRVEREGEPRLVHFWYRSFRSTGMLGAFDQLRDRLVGRVREGRSDGALVRLSTSLIDDEAAARERLHAFASRIDPLLGEHWPEERPAPRD